MTIKLFTNKLKQTCESLEQIDYCEYFGAEGCGNYGSCAYRNNRVLEHLIQLWREATEKEEVGVLE